MSNRYFLSPGTAQSPHFGVLLVVLCLLIVLAPVAAAVESRFGVELLFNLVLITAAYSAAWRGVRRWPFLAFTALTFAARWSALLFGGLGLQLASAATTVVWIAMVIVISLSELFRQRKVDANTIMGAIVTYLLLAVAFAHLYEILELLQPGSFSGLPKGANPDQMGDALIYFSLVSLTTVGYGDIVPVSGLARSIASFEGAFGTLYLAVMIARLVALHIISGLKREKDE